MHIGMKLQRFSIIESRNNNIDYFYNQEDHAWCGFKNGIWAQCATIGSENMPGCYFNDDMNDCCFMFTELVWTMRGDQEYFKNEKDIVVIGMTHQQLMRMRTS